MHGCFFVSARGEGKASKIEQERLDGKLTDDANGDDDVGDDSVRHEVDEFDILVADGAVEVALFLRRGKCGAVCGGGMGVEYPPRLLTHSSFSLSSSPFHPGVLGHHLVGQRGGGQRVGG